MLWQACPASIVFFNFNIPCLLLSLFWGALGYFCVLTGVKNEF